MKDGNEITLNPIEFVLETSESKEETDLTISQRQKAHKSFEELGSFK